MFMVNANIFHMSYLPMWQIKVELACVELALIQQCCELKKFSCLPFHRQGTVNNAMHALRTNCKPPLFIIIIILIIKSANYTLETA